MTTPDVPTDESPIATIVRVGRTIYERELVAATDGNLSIRVGRNEMLVTRSGVSKGDMTESDVIHVDFTGRVLTGSGKPSSELAMHVAVYEERDDVRAIVHAHPPTAVAFTIAGVSLAECVIPEVVLTLGIVPTVPYATPTTGALPDSVRKVIPHVDALMLERHGAVCVGETLDEAYRKLDKLEHAARIIAAAQALGGVKTLPREEVLRLHALRPSFGLTGRNPVDDERLLDELRRNEP